MTNLLLLAILGILIFNLFVTGMDNSNNEMLMNILQKLRDIEAWLKDISKKLNK